MKYITVLIFALFFNLFSVVESNSRIIIENNSLPECADEYDMLSISENPEDFFNLNFDYFKSWNNCRGFMVMNDYFSNLSKATANNRPHSHDGVVILFSNFKDGLPTGKSTAYIGSKLNKSDFIGLSKEEASEKMFGAISAQAPHTYIGNLVEGLPEGEGRLTYTAGFLKFFPQTIEGTWKQGCIDWDEEVIYHSVDFSFVLKPSLIGEKYTVRVEDYNDFADEKIVERIDRYLTQCVPGLKRGS